MEAAKAKPEAVVPEAVVVPPEPPVVEAAAAENRLDDLIKSLNKDKPPEDMIPNNQSAASASKLPLDNYKNNILKAKSQDENKKVGGNAMLSFSTPTTLTPEDKSR